jgi:hypothetical protein
VKRTYLALAAAAAAATAMSDLAAPPRWASAAPSRAPLAQQQQRSWARPSIDNTAEPRQEPLTALPPGAPPPLPEMNTAPVRESQSPRIVALQVIPFSP